MNIAPGVSFDPFSWQTLIETSTTIDATTFDNLRVPTSQHKQESTSTVSNTETSAVPEVDFLNDDDTTSSGSSISTATTDDTTRNVANTSTVVEGAPPSSLPSTNLVPITVAAALAASTTASLQPTISNPSASLSQTQIQQLQYYQIPQTTFSSQNLHPQASSSTVSSSSHAAAPSLNSAIPSSLNTNSIGVEAPTSATGSTTPTIREHATSLITSMQMATAAALTATDSAIIQAATAAAVNAANSVHIQQQRQIHHYQTCPPNPYHQAQASNNPSLQTPPIRHSSSSTAAAAATDSATTAAVSSTERRSHISEAANTPLTEATSPTLTSSSTDTSTSSSSSSASSARFVKKNNKRKGAAEELEDDDCVDQDNVPDAATSEAIRKARRRETNRNAAQVSRANKKKQLERGELAEKALEALESQINKMYSQVKVLGQAYTQLISESHVELPTDNNASSTQMLDTVSKIVHGVMLDTEFLLGKSEKLQEDRDAILAILQPNPSN